MALFYNNVAGPSKYILLEWFKRLPSLRSRACNGLGVDVSKYDLHLLCESGSQVVLFLNSFDISK